MGGAVGMLLVWGREDRGIPSNKPLCKDTESNKHYANIGWGGACSKALPAGSTGPSL